LLSCVLIAAEAPAAAAAASAGLREAGQVRARQCYPLHGGWSLVSCRSGGIPSFTIHFFAVAAAAAAAASAILSEIDRQHKNAGRISCRGRSRQPASQPPPTPPA